MLKTLFVGAVTVSLCSPAVAFPDRLITFIVPFAAGGSTDVVARILAEHMSRTLGQQIVIETVVGAGGTVGTARAAKAAPDGHTIVVGSLGPTSRRSACTTACPTTRSRISSQSLCRFSSRWW
jgi:tripartite-type tricarboxylate transporter receptor subunit TctC